VGTAGVRTVLGGGVKEVSNSKSWDPLLEKGDVKGFEGRFWELAECVSKRGRS